jgi:ZIP family zinc transporter
MAGLLRGERLMEAHGAARDLRATRTGRLPTWLLAVVPLVLIAVAIGAFAALGGPGLGDRRGAPVEELAVEKTVLRPGVIELTVRNDGPDPVTIAQAQINDAFVRFTGADRPVGRLAAATVRLQQPWIEGEAYSIALITSSGATITHEVAAAAETPRASLSFYGLMALLGVYVGVIPIALGMLWLPWLRRIPPSWLRALMALTIGLLGFLAIDATLEGLDLAGEGAQALGGSALVFLGAAVAYLALTGIGEWLSDRQARAASAGASGGQLALMVAVGIGLHNLGEGLAIGTSYATGALALGAFLVAGFALHNTTEGLAIVAPMAHTRAPVGRLLGLGLLAGAPAILGAWIGASAFNSSIAAFLFGVGAGAIAQVIRQLLPAVRDERRRALHPAAVAAMVAGLALMFITGLLVSV